MKPTARQRTSSTLAHSRYVHAGMLATGLAVIAVGAGRVVLGGTRSRAGAADQHRHEGRGESVDRATRALQDPVRQAEHEADETRQLILDEILTHGAEMTAREVVRVLRARFRSACLPDPPTPWLEAVASELAAGRPYVITTWTSDFAATSPFAANGPSSVAAAPAGRRRS